METINVSVSFSLFNSATCIVNSAEKLGKVKQILHKTSIAEGALKDTN